MLDHKFSIKYTPKFVENLNETVDYLYYTV